MNWSRSSKLGLVLLSVLVLFAAVGVASAVSVTSEQAPEEAEVGQEVTVQVELQDLYAEQSSWSLDGRTSLEDPTWTITEYQGGSTVDSYTFNASSPPNGEVQIDESASDAPDRIVVEITGTAPAVDSYSYENPATFRAAELAQVTGNGANIIQEWQIHHYTTGDPGSKEARTALDEASSTIQSASGDTSQAESTFADAVSAFNNGEFATAVSLAEEAESQAQSSGGSDGGSSDGGSSDGGTADANTTDGTSTDGNTSDGSGDGATADDGSNTDSSAGNDSAGNESDSGSDDGGLLWIFLYGLLGLLILGAVGGGIYWFQQQQQGPNRDPLG